MADGEITISTSRSSVTARLRKDIKAIVWIHTTAFPVIFTPTRRSVSAALNGGKHSV
jgi:hypothetical protein